MSFQDPISDMISRIKNAQLRGHDKVSFESSKLKKAIYQLSLEKKINIVSFFVKILGSQMHTA